MKFASVTATIALAAMISSAAVPTATAARPPQRCVKTLGDDDGTRNWSIDRIRTGTMKCSTAYAIEWAFLDALAHDSESGCARDTEGRGRCTLVQRRRGVSTYWACTRHSCTSANGRHRISHRFTVEVL